VLGNYKSVKALNAERLRVLEQMASTQPGTEDYLKLMEQLAKLDAVGTGNRRSPIKWDTVLIVAGGILSTAMLMIYEQKHVIGNSKAWNERPRPETPKP
jgi:hypothetical protein